MLMPLYFKLFFLLAIAKFKCSNDDELILLVKFIRHGAREPIFKFWQSHKFDRYGELTSAGMLQQFDMGQQFRKQYIKEKQFLPKEFNVNDIYVRSTNYSRTIQSARSLIYGLYQETLRPEIDEQVTKIRKNDLTKLFQSSIYESLFKDKTKQIQKNYYFPVNTTHNDNETLLMAFFPPVCPIQNKMVYENIQSEFYQNLKKEFTPTYRKVEKLLNLPENSISNQQLYQIYDNFESYLFALKDIPEIDKDTLREMDFHYKIQVSYLYFSQKQQQKLAVTNIFKELIEKIDNKVNNELNEKLLLYSGHDLTLSSLMHAFNITNHECLYNTFKNRSGNYGQCSKYHPSYGSNIVLEIYKKALSNEYYVKLRYQGKQIKFAENNQKQINWKQLKPIMETYILDNFDSFCKDSSTLTEEEKEILNKETITRGFAKKK